jgi:AraC-like DNA-binding protein
LNDLARVADRPDVWSDDTLPGALWMHGIASEYRIDPVDEYVIGLPTGHAGYDLRRRSTSRRVHVGEMVVLDPEHSHAGTPTPAGPWSARLLVLPMALLRSAGDDTELPALLRSGFDDPVVDSPALRTRFLALHEASRTGAPRLERECGLLALLDDLTSCGKATARPAGDPVVARALEYLRDCWQSPVDLDTLARAAGTTKFRLLRRFRAEVGLTPHRYLVSVRIAHARRLLAAGTPISVAAAETGFADQSHLSRHFRDRLGFTPGRYRHLLAGTGASGPGSRPYPRPRCGG